MELPDAEIPPQGLIGRGKERGQSASVPVGQGLGHLRVLGRQTGQAQGHIFFKDKVI